MAVVVDCLTVEISVKFGGKLVFWICDTVVDSSSSTSTIATYSGFDGGSAKIHQYYEFIPNEYYHLISFL